MSHEINYKNGKKPQKSIGCRVCIINKKLNFSKFKENSKENIDLMKVWFLRSDKTFS